VRVHAELVVARVRLAAGDTAGARRVLASARALVAKTERVMTRWALEALEARIELAEARPARAQERLLAVRRLLTPKGLVLVELETRLLLATAGLATGHPGARRDIAALVADAQSHGAGLIRQRATQLGW